MGGVKDAVLGLGDTIIGGITDVLKALFVPSNDFFDKQLGNLTNKFGFVSSIVNIIKGFINNFSTSEDVPAPSFTLDLSKINSRFDYGGTVTIDFSWYAPYRADVSNFISGFMWLVFLWNCFKDLPGIISGVGGGASSIAQVNAKEN